MSKVDDLLDRSITGYRLPDLKIDDNIYDLSKIDFEAMSEKFQKARDKRTKVESIKNAVQNKIDQMVKVNKHRLDYLNKLNDLIADYNDGAQSVEETFERLMKLIEKLKEEEKRYIREELDNEMELAIFDLLTNPEPELSDQEVKEVKQVARKLYNRLNTIIAALDWRKKQKKKAEVQVAIKTILNDGLPQIYDKTIFDQKRVSIYDYVYETM